MPRKQVVVIPSVLPFRNYMCPRRWVSQVSQVRAITDTWPKLCSSTWPVIVNICYQLELTWASSICVNSHPSFLEGANSLIRLGHVDREGRRHSHFQLTTRRTNLGMEGLVTRISQSSSPHIPTLRFQYPILHYALCMPFCTHTIFKEPNLHYTPSVTNPDLSTHSAFNSQSSFHRALAPIVTQCI